MYRNKRRPAIKEALTMGNKQVYRLAGLGCARCAQAMEMELGKLPGVRRARIDFAAGSLTILSDGEGPALALVQRTLSSLEPGVTARRERVGIRAVPAAQRARWVTLGLGAAALIAGLLMKGPLSLAFFSAAYLLCGADTLARAGRDMAGGRVFGENLLMSVATLGALAIGEYPEAVAVMLFFRVGMLLEAAAVGRTRRSIAALMDIRPDTATVEWDGRETQLPPERVAVGDILLIKPGERVSLDGVVVSGTANLDTAALTGEAAPRAVAQADEVLSGCINLDGVLRVRVTKPYGQSTVARILALVEDAGRRKAPAEHFITGFSRVYTPAVLGLAAALAVLPPLILGGGWQDWIYRALVFLVVSCPCALAVSVPLTFFAGLGGASRGGILIKGGNYLEALARVKTVAFDKTGTLTQGRFVVEKILPAMGDEQALLETAAYAEGASTHPIARAVAAAWGQPLTPGRVTATREIAGQGVAVTFDGHAVLAGNDKLMAEAGITPQAAPEGTAVHIAVDGKYAGVLTVADQLKDGAARAMAGLKAAGVSHTVLLTGDVEAPGWAAALALGISHAYTGLLPQDKVERVEALLRDKPAGSRVAFVGDGINDAPVLARADVGIAMGALGSDAAIEAADVVLMTDRLEALPAALSLARRTLMIARQNIALALTVKLIILALGAAGLATLWAAVFADVGVTLLAVMNALRALKPAGPARQPNGGERAAAQARP